MRDEGRGGSYLPPMTLLSPLNTFVKLLTTTSAYGRTCTFRKFPTVSSTTTAKWYLSASSRIRTMLGDLRSGFEGNSQKRARMSSPDSSFFSNSSSSSCEPWPKKWQPGPNFSRILRVSMYGNLWFY